MKRDRENSFDLKRLRAGIKPLRLYWFSRLKSTSDHAAAMRKRGDLFAPAIVLTGHQTAGRGRGTHSWWSGSGTLTATFAFPIDDDLAPHHLPLIAGLAVRDAAAAASDRAGIQLKWPNDLLFDGRKLAGLLCERVVKADLVGLGLNVNVDPADGPKHLRERITSLSVIAGRSLDMTDVLIEISRHLHRAMSRRRENSFAAVLREYDRHHALIGRQVHVTDNGENITGRCEGLDSLGRLLLRQGPKLHRVIAGQVHLS